LQTSKPTAVALGIPIYAEHGEQKGTQAQACLPHLRGN